ncbi:MAG: twin-arginine translocase subunit TatC [Synergistaceae bacterium]|nr:twin-arginine translocase subunit TatC [Synergistaceae bacterium]
MAGGAIDEWEEHLEELRRRIIKILVVFFLSTLVSFAFSEQIVEFLTSPVSHLDVRLYTFAPSEKFMAHLHISALMGVVATAPFFILQACLFIWPALKKNERTYTLCAAGLIPCLFIAGASAAYRFFSPVILDFFLSFRSGDGVEPLWSFKEYLSLLACLMAGTGVMLQMPLFLLALFALGVVTPERVSSFRGYAILLIFFLAAVLTPPDVTSQIMLGVPLYLLFEMTIVAGRVMRRSK